MCFRKGTSYFRFILAAILTFALGVGIVWLAALPQQSIPPLQIQMAERNLPPVIMDYVMRASRPAGPCSTLIVRIDADRRVWLNTEEVGSVEHTGALAERIRWILEQRREMELDIHGVERCTDIPADEPVVQTVFIKAVDTTAYGDISKVLAAVQASGAEHIALVADR